jgi:hypothetical protein
MTTQDTPRPFNMLVSFPRSGTDFFCRALMRDRKIKYFREYFNPICNPKRRDVLRKCFGCEEMKSYLEIMGETSAEAVDDVVKESWTLDNFNTTKENFSALKIEFLIKHFNMVALIRKPFHTFPTSRPEFILPILNSFLQAGAYRNVFLAEELNELRNFIARIRIIDVHNAGLMAYLVHNYILLAACKKFDINIMSYEDLILQEETALEAAISSISLFGANPLGVSRAIIKDRANFAETLTDRKQRFDAAVHAPWFDGVVQLLISMSPQIKRELECYLTLDL